MYKLLLFLTAFFLLSLNLQGQDLFHQDSITKVEVFFEEEDWMHILDSLEEARFDERLEGKVYVNGKKYKDSGIRYKGNSSFHSVQRSGDLKFPLNIKTTYDHKKNKLPGGYTRLKLANGFRDPSFIREVISYEIARKYMPASKSNFAKVYVNEEYLGLYTSSEPVDKAFLKNNFGSHKGVLIKCDPDWRAKRPEHCPKGDKSSLNFLGTDTVCYDGLYELKSKYGWEELMKLTKAIHENSDQIEQILDINQTLWLMAFNNVLVNLDSYLGAFCHNYYLYQDTFGVFHPIVWDLNLSFGGFTLLDEKTVLSKEKLQKLSLFTNYSNDNRPLLSVLLKNDLYRKIYVANIKTIVEENFQDSSFYNHLKATMDLIAPHVKEDTNKLYTFEDFQNSLDSTIDVNGFKVVGIKELMDERLKYIVNHPLMKRVAPEVLEVVNERNDNTINIQASISGGAQQVYLCYRKEKYHNFIRIPMEAGAAFEEENRQIWTIDIPREEIQHYYVIAEGEKAAALMPRRAGTEFFEINEVVKE